jgi:hypothetical protein
MRNTIQTFEEIILGLLRSTLKQKNVKSQQNNTLQ